MDKNLEEDRHIFGKDMERELLPSIVLNVRNESRYQSKLIGKRSNSNSAKMFERQDGLMLNASHKNVDTLEDDKFLKFGQDFKTCPRCQKWPKHPIRDKFKEWTAKWYAKIVRETPEDRSFKKDHDFLKDKKFLAIRLITDVFYL